MQQVNRWLIGGLLIIVGCSGGQQTRHGTAGEAVADNEASAGKRVLFYSQSFGYQHRVVRRPLTGELSPAERVFKQIASEAGYQVLLSQDHNHLMRTDFRDIDAIIFYSSGPLPITPKDHDRFLQWVRAGGAVVGVHPAVDSARGWPEFGRLMGALFKHHGPGDKEVTIKVEDTTHPTTRMLGTEWVIADEIYQFHERSFSRDEAHVLMSIDKAKTDLKTQEMSADKDYPLAWTKKVGNGRLFYTALGHEMNVWEDERFQQHLLAGLGWTLGEQ